MFQARSLRHRIVGLYLGLVLANLSVWAWALIAFQSFPLLLGSALLAYSFGLRHAVDADHIAAIDNITRRLMQAGKRPVTIGLFFSLGHSSVVIVLSILIVATTSALQARFEAFKEIGGVIGTLISVVFLFGLGTLNLMILVATYRAFRRARRGEVLAEADLDLLLSGGGILSRLSRPLFRLVESGWHVYLLGFLFGLGFETATEIGLLGIAATEASKGLPIWSMLVFPALFTAGMTLVDSTDNILMLGAYGWAFAKPLRKLYYNMTITSVSVLVALLVGGIEALGLAVEQFDLKGEVWQAIGVLNENFGLLGYVIIGIFAASWLISVVIYRLGKYDEVRAP